MSTSMHDQAVIIEDSISESYLDAMLTFAKSNNGYKEAISKNESGQSYYQFIPISANSSSFVEDQTLIDAAKESHKALYDALAKNTSLPILTEEYCGLSICANYSMSYHADAERPYCVKDRNLGKPSDAGHEGFNNPSKQEWQPNHTPNRVYTSLVYLTDDFHGGETTMPQRNLDVKPKKGRLFGFPCSRDYIHGIRKNTGGLRIAFTAWYKLSDQKVEDPFGHKDRTCADNP
jgi:hypothetical protein